MVLGGSLEQVVLQAHPTPARAQIELLEPFPLEPLHACQDHQIRLAPPACAMVQTSMSCSWHRLSPWSFLAQRRGGGQDEDVLRVHRVLLHQGLRGSARHVLATPQMYTSVSTGAGPCTGSGACGEGTQVVDGAVTCSVCEMLWTSTERV